MDTAYALSLLCITFIGSAIGGGLVSYVKKKFENQATREDIQELTRSVEDVKSEFTEEAAKRQREHTFFLETFKAEQTLRVLAGQERLKAHQEAFALWRRLWDQSENLDLIHEADKWWREHCLYLDKPARQAFIEGLSALKGRCELMEQACQDGHEAPLELLWAKFELVPAELFKGAGLPPLVKEELPQLEGKNS
jgi:uncharacterized membrane protein YccC